MVLLLRALRNTTYYEESGLGVARGPGAGLAREEVVLGRILYKLRLIMDMNAHPVWGVELSPRDTARVGTEQVGQGLYTAIASFFNSDCNPNTLRINMGRRMFLVAARNIRKGEEITDNYCTHFSDMPGAERREWIEVRTVDTCNITTVMLTTAPCFRRLSSSAAAARRARRSGPPTSASPRTGPRRR